MALDWSNERYVRLYTRVTPDMAMWCWQAKAIWPWLLANAERSGGIAAKRVGCAGLAKLIGMPVEVVEAGLNGAGDDVGLLEDGCVVATADGYAIRNYVEAQTAQSSATKRAADYRARQRLGESLDSKDGDSAVTHRHAPSRTPDSERSSSPPVTPSGSDPSGTEPSRDTEPAASPPLALAFGAISETAPDPVARAWSRQESRRAKNPALRPLKLTLARRREVAARLREHGEDLCNAVTDGYAAEAERTGDWQFFDGVTNWRAANVERAIGRMGTHARAGPSAPHRPTPPRLQRFPDDPP